MATPSAFAAVLQDLGINLLAGVLLAAAAVVFSRLGFILSRRRLWRLSDPERVAVCVSESVVVQTGKYRRPATGIGQLRALAVIAPSLQRAYRKLDLSDVRLSTDPLFEHLEVDLISLGGSKNNQVTRDILSCLQKQDGLPITSDGSTIGCGGQIFEAEIDDDGVVMDYGFVVRARNPFNSHRRVVVIAGASTYGTAAAARYFVERCLWRQGDFFAVVSAPVRQRHVTEPRLIVSGRRHGAGDWR